MTTEDIMGTDCREKIEHFEDYLFVVAKELRYADGSNKLMSVPVNIIVNLILNFNILFFLKGTFKYCGYYS